MYAKLIAGLACGLLFVGCSSTAERFRTDYDPTYSVVDNGGTDVITTGTACSATPREAARNARKAAEFHLRSVAGDRNRYLPRTQEVRRYSQGDETCVEMSAVAVPK
jgi:hypothetical protein